MIKVRVCIQHQRPIGGLVLDTDMHFDHTKRSCLPLGVTPPAAHDPIATLGSLYNLTLSIWLPLAINRYCQCISVIDTAHTFGLSV